MAAMILASPSIGRVAPRRRASMRAASGQPPDLPATQGQGIGARLLALAEDRARALHVPEIRLYANAAMTENLAYYSRQGYTETYRAHQDGFPESSSANGWTPDRPNRGIMWVIFDHLRPSGHIMPDHAGDRGAVPSVLAPHDHLDINQMRAFSVQWT